MPSPFEIASALTPSGENEFTAEIPPGWDQGRAAFGGLVLGVMARAMETVEHEKARAMRTIIGDICGPVLPGQVKLTVRSNRRGNNQSNLEVHLEQAGEVLALGSAVFATKRKAVIPEFATEVLPPQPAWRAVETAPVRPPLGPPFARHLEFRPIYGVPHSSQPTPDVAGYVALKGQERPLDAADIMALLDAHWPGVLAMGDAPRATATVSFAGQIVCDLEAVDWRSPLFYRSKIVAKHAGYFLELRELWQDGKYVAMNQQTLAMIK